jgi:hypothetical protein
MALRPQLQIDAYHRCSLTCSIARLPTGLLPQLIDAWCNSKPTAGRGIKLAEFALTSALVMVWISPTSLIVEYQAPESLARARDDRLLAMISHATHQRERKRVFSDFAGKIAEELGWQTLAGIVCELVDQLARRRSARSSSNVSVSRGAGLMGVPLEPLASGSHGRS